MRYVRHWQRHGGQRSGLTPFSSALHKIALALAAFLRKLGLDVINLLLFPCSDRLHARRGLKG
eukprot:2781504-Pleurochrysis_carterae.AAC.1